ncbi:MAG: HAD hydrolase family protein [Anaerolineales bacterium]
MRNIQLITVDLDGTLLTSEKVLAPGGTRSLKAAAEDGIHIILASTRNPHFVQKYCRTLEIHDPIICSNGAQIWGHRKDLSGVITLSPGKQPWKLPNWRTHTIGS